MSDERPGGFWVRLVASLIDGTLVYLVSIVIVLVILGAMYWIGRVAPGADPTAFGESFTGTFAQILFSVISTPLWFAYYTVGHTRWGTTVGKLPFKLYVVDREGRSPAWGRSLWRCFGYVLSYLPFGAGYLMAAFSPERLALHDLVSGTRVIRRAAAAVAAVLALCLSLAPAPARASLPMPQLGVMGLVLNQDRGSGATAFGTRIELGTKWRLVEDRGFTVGPRVGLDLIPSDPVRRNAVSLGGEASLWLMNAIGLGLGLDYAAALAKGSGPSSWAVVEPFLRLRLERIGVGGAFVLHAAPIYETAYGFGWKVGLIWEVSGLLGP